METRRLSYFIRIAEDGSLTKASGVLRVAQPALSRQMRLLEEELGVALFHRTARGMQLTEEGEYLRSAAAGPLRELEMALQNIRSLRSSIDANFTLGMPSSLTDLLAMPLARAFREKFPNIRFCMVEGYTGSLIDWLARGIIDFALLEETSRNDQLAEQKLVSLPLVLAGPPDSPLAAGQTVSLTTALQLPLVLPSHHLGIRPVINDAAARMQAKLNLSFEADSSRLIGELVASGLGYTLLPACYLTKEVTREVAEGRLQTWPIAKPSLSLDIFLASRKNSKISGRQFSEVEAAIADLALGILSADQPQP